MTTPELKDITNIDDEQVVQYMIDHFEHLKIESGQIDLFSAEETYIRYIEVLEKVKEIV